MKTVSHVSGHLPALSSGLVQVGQYAQAMLDVDTTQRVDDPLLTDPLSAPQLISGKQHIQRISSLVVSLFACSQASTHRSPKIPATGRRAQKKPSISWQAAHPTHRH